MASPRVQRSRRSEGDAHRRGREHGRSRNSDGERDGRGRARDSDRDEAAVRRRSEDDGRDGARRGGRERSSDREEREKWETRTRVKDEAKEPRSVENVFKRERGDEAAMEDLSSKRVKVEPGDIENEDRDGDEAKEIPRRSKDDSIALMEQAEAALEAKEQAKEKASFEYTGKLAAETNKVSGIALQFTEPPEARQPSVRWRLYVFKDGAPLEDPLFIHRQSCYLFGRERKVADIPIDHPSCSKQHAVIQYRLIEKEVDGLMSKKIRPYVMDLGSTNKTFLNGEAVEPQRYYELFEKDTLKFGNSSREYVLLHENSA
ncbi:FHA domain-containing protein DDL isoform X1 [Selaginella moellendorffii]|nr:FHA domain-containing protein DDL isoform X1 [Selaginella moellendorffii]|eukprot:XP_024544443.1 FHA domain-containing protein DDL isoform X1 [Selaginella moellendorffii]